MRVGSIALCVLLPALAGIPAFAADVAVYDDALAPNFLDYSYYAAGGNVDMANTVHVHSGTHSIAFTAASYDAVKIANNTALFDTAANSKVHLWFYGTTAQCQALDLIVERNNGVSDDLLGQAAISAYANCAGIVAGQWLEVTVDMTAAPIAYNGTYDRISFFNRDGQPLGPVYFDDISLLATSSLPDEIFKGDFEGGAAAAGTIQIEPNVTACNGNLLSERYTWTDAAGRARSATLSHNDTAQNAGHQGELCDLTYHTDAVTVRDASMLNNGGAGGFGYIVSHLYNTAPSDQIGQDDSPLGLAFQGTFARLLNGRHHAILRFRLNYPRYYCAMAAPPDGPCTGATTTYQMPVTIDWLIATGRDHPLWSVSFDLNGAPANAIVADSRAPYGSMNFDGGSGDTVMGVAWGDHYKFRSTGASPVSLNSSWDWTQTNTIPYVYLWTQNVDAEMGVVQSEDIAKQDAGGYYGQQGWTHTSADPGFPGRCSTTPFSDGSYVMPCDFNWPYQSINYSLSIASPNGSTSDKRLAWGTEFGFLGQQSYDGNDGSTILVPSQRQSYATYIVLGLHSVAATANQVIQVENAMSSTMTASVGSVTASGPAGVGRSDTRTFQPAGYNRVYGTWEVNAAAGSASVTLNAGGGGLLNPMFIVHNHANALPASATLDGGALIADVDYFATIDPANADHADTRLWITVNRNWVGSHTLAVQ